MEYSAYLNTEHWGVMKRLRAEIDGNECAICGIKSNLNVHHKSYKRLGAEKLSDLITLCKQCHSKYHVKLKSDFREGEKVHTKNNYTIVRNYGDIEIQSELISTSEIYINGEFVSKILGKSVIKIKKLEEGLNIITLKTKEDTRFEEIEITSNKTSKISFVHTEKEFKILADILQNSIQEDNIKKVLRIFSLKDLDKYINSSSYLWVFNSIFFNKPEYIEKFVENGFDMNLNAKSINIGYIFDNSRSSLEKNISVINALIKSGYPINCNINPYNNLLQKAVDYKKKEIIEYLLEEGADINQIFIENNKPILFYATNYDMLYFLLERGADPKMIDCDNNSLIFYAVKYCNLDQVKEILKLGFDIKVKNRLNQNLLFASIIGSMNPKEEKDRIVNLFIEEGVEFNEKYAGASFKEQYPEYF